MACPERSASCWIVLLDRHVCVTEANDLLGATRASLDDKLLAPLHLPLGFVAGHGFLIDLFLCQRLSPCGSGRPSQR